MKNILILLFILLNASLLTAQSDTTNLTKKPAYLYFYREKQFLGCGNGIGIKINSTKMKRIWNGKRLIIELCSQDSIVKIQSYNLINNPTIFSILEIEPKSGMIYYIKTYWDNYVELLPNRQMPFSGPGINFDLQPENTGKLEFANDENFYDDQTEIKTIKYTNE